MVMFLVFHFGKITEGNSQWEHAPKKSFHSVGQNFPAKGRYFDSLSFGSSKR